MVSKSERRKKLAREHYDKYQERRATEQAKRRRRLNILAVVTTVLAVVALGVWGSVVMFQDDDTTAPAAAATEVPSASAEPSASTAPGECAYTPTGDASKDVGVPPAAVGDVSAPRTATLTLSGQPVTIALDGAKAPCTVASFEYLASKQYFDGTTCHRLVTSSGLQVLQCGDPTGTGSGGPGYQYPNENTDGATYPAGTVAMANAGAGTNGSQFFLVYADSTLPPDYSVFGTITGGLDAITAIAAGGVTGGGTDGKPATPATLDSVTVAQG